MKKVDHQRSKNFQIFQRSRAKEEKSGRAIFVERNTVGNVGLNRVVSSVGKPIIPQINAQVR